MMKIDWFNNFIKMPWTGLNITWKITLMYSCISQKKFIDIYSPFLTFVTIFKSSRNDNNSLYMHNSWTIYIHSIWLCIWMTIEWVWEQVFDGIISSYFVASSHLLHEIKSIRLVGCPEICTKIQTAAQVWKLHCMWINQIE
jgi:hypothetical protein